VNDSYHKNDKKKYTAKHGIVGRGRASSEDAAR